MLLNCLFLTKFLLLTLKCFDYASARLWFPSCPADAARSWSYDDRLNNGPKDWGRLFEGCNGTQQSPINIQTSDVQTDENLQKLQLTNYDKPLTHYELENDDGHAVKITPLDDVTRSVLINGETYTLNQFHFHWGYKYNSGSEHTINGKQYIMEIHFVHIDQNNRIAVVGVLYKLLLSRSGLSPITENLKRIPHRGDTVELKRKLYLNKLIDVDCSFYRYDGSLTTPDCDEGVTWSLCKNPLSIGASQITEFWKLYSTEEDETFCRITGNFRPVQPLNGRTVTSSE